MPKEYDSERDTTVKISKKTIELLAKRARPFESRKKVLERLILEFDKRDEK